MRICLWTSKRTEDCVVRFRASRMMTKEKAAHTKETQVKLLNPFPRPF